MKVFSVDLGSRLVGWAYHGESGLVSAGVWNLEPRRSQSRGVRWLRFRRLLDDVVEISRLPIDLVAYEEVRAHVSRGKKGEPRMNVAAAHAFGASEAMLQAWCEERRLDFTSVQISAVKTAALGKGGGKGTSKKEVLAAAKARWPHLVFEDDNAADAAFIGRAVRIELGSELSIKEEDLIHETRQRRLPVHR